MTVRTRYLLFVYEEHGRLRVDNCGNSAEYSQAATTLSQVEKLATNASLPCKVTQDDKTVYITVFRDSEMWKPQLNPEWIRAYTLAPNSWDSNHLFDKSAQPILDQASAEALADLASKAMKSCYIGGFKKRDINRATDPPAKRPPSELGYWLGSVQVSRVGFNAAKNEALVYTGSYCGALCGSGYLFLLRKSGDHWEIVARHNLWVS